MKRVDFWFDKPCYIGLFILLKRINSIHPTGLISKMYKAQNLSQDKIGEWITFHFGFGIQKTWQDESGMTKDQIRERAKKLIV